MITLFYKHFQEIMREEFIIEVLFEFLSFFHVHLHYIKIYRFVMIVFNITITVLDIIDCPVFYLKLNSAL
jgi:hypothetical protein